MKNTNIDQKLKIFLAEKLLITLSESIKEETDLFEQGLIDSYGYMELVKFIESEFSIKFTNAELVSDAFTSVSKMTKIIMEKSNVR